MAKRQANVKNLLNFINYTKTDEQKDLIALVVSNYSSGKIHKLITANNSIKSILNTKASREKVIKQLPTLETKEPVNKILYKNENPTNKLNQFLTIKEQACILDGLKCFEYPNIDTLEKLLNSDLLNTVKYENKGIGTVYENELKQLEGYMAKIDKGGKVKVIYKKIRRLLFGRVYCDEYIGAIAMRKEIRGSLFYDRYVDIDMCNCHPNIYYQIAKLYNIDCPTLENYILHREDVLNTIREYYNVDRCTAKQLFIRLLYLGGFKSWAVENKITKGELPFIKKIRRELIAISDKIYDNNPLLVKQIIEHLNNNKKTYTQHKLKCTVISYFNQEIECRLLEQIYLYCVSKGYIKNNTCSLCYDGIMILKTMYNAQILQEFSKVIFNKFGLNVKFEEKAMDHYLDIINDHITNKRNTITINQRYLLDKEKLLNDDTLFVNQIKHFLSNPCKSLNIKSPYDTGKTQLLKSILKDYPQYKRVLMVTYRITLSYEFESVFSEFDFANYKNGNFAAPHLINQTESLLRLTDNVDVLPKYDLIIIDEIESVLNQFYSPTFKGKSSNAFALLVALCKNPNTKFISLDGDLSDRAHAFIDYFGSAVNINNKCSFNTKTLNMYMVTKKHLQAFENRMMIDLANNLKLVIPTMSATYGYEILKTINDKYPNKKVIIYTSTTSDSEKQDIKGIVDLWSSADVVIYSPTIEAGVSFDVLGHFDKVYGYMCTGSCSQRSYLQMLSRVRKFNTDEFNIYSNIDIDTKGKLWAYEEIDENSLYPRDLILNNEYEYDESTEETRIVRKNELYRQIYIHNLTEDKNKHPKAFIKTFFDLANKKGYAINIVNVDDDEQCAKQDSKLLTKYIEVLDAPIIDASTYNEYCLLQKIGNAKKIEKLAIQKYLIQVNLGIDNLNYTDDESKFKAYQIVKKFMNHSTTFKNLIALIDETNNKDKDELQVLTRKQLIVYVKQIINKLGFAHCYDKTKISSTNFTNNTNAVCALLSDLSKDSIFNQMLNISKDDLSYLQDKDLSSQMRKINTILNRCGIKVSSEVISRISGTTTTTKQYYLEFIDQYDEILSNKISYQNFKINDTFNIYQHTELNYFKSYITKSPLDSKIDVSGLDFFIEDVKETPPIIYKQITNDEDEVYYIPCTEQPINTITAKRKVMLSFD
jgi:hypothetical protein